MDGRLLSRVIALGRLGLGVLAAVAPDLAAGVWVGSDTAGTPASRVLGRALAGRDLALAGGALLARSPEETRRWVVAGAIADAGDALATVAHWATLPKVGRQLVLAASAGAAVLGAVAAVTMGEPARP